MIFFSFVFQTSENGLDEKSTEIACLERDLVKLSGEKNEVSFSVNDTC